MNIEMRDTITLDDNKDYLVVGKANYKDTDYLFLIELEELTLKFAALAGSQVLLLNNKTDKALIGELFPLFAQNIQYEFNKNGEENNN